MISVIRSLLPPEAQIGRCGSDEFIILLEGNGWQEVNFLMEKIVETVSNPRVKAGGKTFPVTVSAGGAFWDPSCLDCEQLLNKADSALYDATRNGRNRFVLINRRRRIKEETAETPKRDKSPRF